MKTITYRSRSRVSLVIAVLLAAATGMLPVAGNAAGSRPADAITTALQARLNAGQPEVSRTMPRLALLRVFGEQGAVLNLSRNLPEYARKSFQMADRHTAAGYTRPDAYLFLEKRF